MVRAVDLPDGDCKVFTSLYLAFIVDGHRLMKALPYAPHCHDQRVDEVHDNGFLLVGLASPC